MRSRTKNFSLFVLFVALVNFSWLAVADVDLSINDDSLSKNRIGISPALKLESNKYFHNLINTLATSAVDTHYGPENKKASVFVDVVFNNKKFQTDLRKYGKKQKKNNLTATAKNQIKEEHLSERVENFSDEKIEMLPEVIPMRLGNLNIDLESTSDKLFDDAQLLRDQEEYLGEHPPIDIMINMPGFPNRFLSESAYNIGSYIKSLNVKVIFPYDFPETAQYSFKEHLLKHEELQQFFGSNSSSVLTIINANTPAGVLNPMLHWYNTLVNPENPTVGSLISGGLLSLVLMFSVLLLVRAYRRGNKSADDPFSDMADDDPELIKHRLENLNEDHLLRLAQEVNAEELSLFLGALTMAEFRKVSVVVDPETLKETVRFVAEQNTPSREARTLLADKITLTEKGKVTPGSYEEILYRIIEETNVLEGDRVAELVGDDRILKCHILMRKLFISDIQYISPDLLADALESMGAGKTAELLAVAGDDLRHMALIVLKERGELNTLNTQIQALENDSVRMMSIPHFRMEILENLTTILAAELQHNPDELSQFLDRWSNDNPTEEATIDIVPQVS